MRDIQFEPEFEAWRPLARQLLHEGVPPDEVIWNGSQVDGEQLGLFGATEVSEPPSRVTQGRVFNVPKEFIKDAPAVACARVEDRWDLLYRILYRLKFEDHNLMKITVDNDVARFYQLLKSVRRDIHKMHAFVRFKKVMIDGNELYLAWHKPEHYTVRVGTPFFARRFGDRMWSIFTPDLSAHWDLNELTFGPGIPQHEFPHTDEWDEVWKTYYRSIFNPARIKLKAMRAEMAPKYWSSMPETELLKDLIREAPERLKAMAALQKPEAQVPLDADLPQLKEAAKECTACPLFQRATQTVFGEGPANARIVVIGEQPGDQEDIDGRPFVGPAGQVLDHALQLAGLDRAKLYLTNAVKHFKWAPRGKMRLHQKPNGSEMSACKPWLEAEIQRIKPDLVVLLGATAGTAWLGRLPKVTTERGQILRGRPGMPAAILSWHPSAILRSSTEEEKAQRQAELAADLQQAALFLSAQSDLAVQKLASHLDGP